MTSLSVVTAASEPRGHPRQPAIGAPEPAAPGHPRAGRLTRWLPVLLLALVALLGIRLITTGDVWWHLKTGEYFVQHRAFPDRDPFVYTAGTDRWIIRAWLTEVVFYLVFRATGFAGLTLFKAALFTLAVGLLWRLGRTVGCPAPAAAVVLLLLALVARPRLVERPEVVSFLLVAAALSLLVRGAWGRAAYLLVPLQVLWANVHSSFLLGLLLPWPFLADAAVRRLRAPRPGAGEGAPPLRHLARAAVLLVPASTLTPEGTRLLLYPFSLARMPTVRQIEEVQGLLTVLRGCTACRAEAIALFVLAVGTLVVCALRRRSGTAVGPGTWGLAAGAIAMPIAFYRLLPYAGMILAAVALKGLGVLAAARPGEAAAARRPAWRRVLAGGVCVVLLALGAFSVARDPRFQFGLGVTPRKFPEGAARFILSANAQGPLLNDLNIGTYLLWSLFPRHRVFAHAAFWDSVSDDRLIARYMASARAPGIFEVLVREYRVQLLVLQNHLPLSRVVATDRRWALVYWDEVASVYARRDGANAGLITAHEFRLTEFAANLGYLLVLAQDAGAFQAAAGELRRAVREDRGNAAASLSLAVLLKARGQDLEEALEALEVAQRYGFRHPNALAWKAEILARLGRWPAAAAAARETLRRDPANAAANLVLADLRAWAGESEDAERAPTDGLDGPWVIGP
jgi:hypothetical protein